VGDLGVDVSAIKRVVLTDGRSAVELLSDRIPEETIVVPERIIYPDLRKAFDPGTFESGDVVVVSIQVYDRDGKEKIINDSVFKMPLDNYTKDRTKEVLGVIYFNFVESNRQIQESKEEKI
jgi:hypothetical protein